MRLRRIRLATRGSALALAQVDLAAEALARVARSGGHGAVEVERVVVRTEGDRRLDADLSAIGGQGVFVKEVQAAVLEGRADVAVHSAKDLPPVVPPGLVLVSVPERADPRDALVGAPLHALGPGAVVATGSARRRAQLANLRPDLVFVGIRGNMARRLGRVDDGTVAAVVAAAAGLDRLGWEHRAAERLPVSWCLPQAGQGALALECREDDPDTAALLVATDDPASHRALAAERAFLRALGAGCLLPVAAWAKETGGAPGGGPRRALELHGMIATRDGRVLVRDRMEGDDPDALGASLAAHLVGPCGASSIEGSWAQLAGGAAAGAGVP